MRNVVLRFASIMGGASLLLLAGCSTMETAGPAAGSGPAPVMATEKADLPRKSAMTHVGIAPIEAVSATAYMEQQAGDLRRTLGAAGVGVVRRGTRLVITLLEIEDRSVKDIAEITGWSVPLVKVRAFRARAEMRKIVAKMAKDKYL